MTSASAVLSAESIASSFLYGTLPKINGRPKFMDIYNAFKLQQVNAAEIHTTNGGGEHGYLGALLPAATYANVSQTAWATPDFPGQYPAVDGTETAAQIRAITEQHIEELREFKQHHNVQQALKKQLIDCFDIAFLEGYKQQYVQFGNRLIGPFYVWLFQQYGTLSPQDHDINTAKFNSEWDPSMPFESYAAKLEEASEIATLSGTAFSTAQTLATAVSKVFKTALYFDDLQKWNAKTDADRTWGNFKTHMALAQSRLSVEQETTAARGGFANHHSANMAQQQLEATQAQLFAAQEMIETLLTATKTGNTQDNNSDKRLDDITTLLKQQANELKQVKGAMTSFKATGEGRTKGNTKAPPPDPEGYCWTHGYKVAMNHNSGTCRCGISGHHLFDPNHKKEATRANNMGGSQKNKDWKP
jgi:hypothetical protein